MMLLVASSAGATDTIDAIAATVDDIVVTISDLDRLEVVFLVPRIDQESRETYRKRLLEHLIDRILQRRDIRRFSAIDVDPKAVDGYVDVLSRMHGSDEDFDRVLQRVGMTVDDVRDVIAMELEVRAYIDERFAPLVFIPQEDVERHYEENVAAPRRDAGLPVQPFAEVREGLRDQLRSEQLKVEVDQWTRQLRSRANVDVFTYR